MKLFQKVVTDCSLFDLGYCGSKYTYSNKRKGAHKYKSRLDRVLVSQAWLHEYPGAINTHMFTYSSDHKALCLQLRGRHNNRTRVLRFENMWFQEESFQQIINSAWQNYSDSPFSFEDKLMLLQDHLTKWNRTKFGNVQAKIKDLKVKLEEMSGKERTELSIQQEHQLTSDLDDWLHREEILWRQRSRALWLDDGDNNSKYFHAYASSRKKLNSITRLIDGTGEATTDPGRIKDIITQHYRGFFGQSNSISLQEILFNIECLQGKVTDQYNAMLTAPYTEQEITRAVFQLHLMKAPGKDGFNAAFYQVCWPIVKTDFIKDCLKFLNEGFLNSEANILHEVVSPEQCAFVPDRLITDNLLISHEIIHYIRGVTTGRRRVFGSLKLDIAKAYDTVD
ncbi:hypothetical protein QQ045_023081 [Rhodiola kirilowii]